MKNNILYYNTPATKWIEALPIGNGRVGAMVFGGANCEHLQLNEETLWSGYFDKLADNPETAKHIDEIRELLFAKKTYEAEKLAEKYMVCGGFGPKYHNGQPFSYGSYQTAGRVYAKLNHSEEISDYSRVLDIHNGETRIEYTADGKHFTRNVFASIDDNVVVMRMACDGVFDCSFTYDRENVALQSADDGLLACGQFESLSWTLAFRVKTDGKVSVVNSEVCVSDAKYCDVYIAIASDYRGAVPDPIKGVYCTLDNAIQKGYDALHTASVAKFASLMERSDIDIGGVDSGLPFNEKLALIREDKLEKADLLAVMETLWKFARYLSIASSFNSVLPSNLQGIWAEEYRALWGADYHININIQMNYWLTELTDLPECADVFVKFVKFFSEKGKDTARIQYNCGGWVAHTFSTPWAFTSLGNRVQTGSFMCGGAWSCEHIWERWLFGRDINFLREYYPVLRGACEFFLDFLTKDPNTGYLVTAPSHSPENLYKDPVTGEALAVCSGPTCDTSIIYELFTNTAEAASILGLDKDFAEKLIAVRDQLPPIKIGKYGQIMEWQEEFEETEIGHRHLSNLYGFHPSARITKTKTPELFEAAAVTLKRRVDHGSGQCGFSRAWLISMYARLGDAQACYEHIKVLLRQQIYNNMFNCDQASWHPVPFYQIDANFGACAGMVEMLIQSHDGYIELLPALPAEWANGSFNGLCARGGFAVDAEWRDGKLVSAVIESRAGEACELRYKDNVYTPEIAKGEKVTLTF